MDRQAGTAPALRPKGGADAPAALIEKRKLAPLLLLPFLAEDLLTAVLDALALVGLGLAPAADFGGHLANTLLVDTR